MTTSLYRTFQSSSSRKTVVVHRGARDGYQVALALAETEMLEALVTDLYWPDDRNWTQKLEAFLPTPACSQLRARCCAGLPSSLVHTCSGTGLLSFGLEKWRSAPFTWRRSATRESDAVLGKTAGLLASKQNAALLSYSYYGHSAFSNYQGLGARILFQLHPHPTSVRHLLLEELEAHPECRISLRKEWELSLPEADFSNLVGEAAMADYWIAASSFTRRTLIENGASSDRVYVIPYGVDLDRFHPQGRSADLSRPLRLLFVGTINQRKGIKYALEALKTLPRGSFQFTVCGRVVDDLRIFEPFREFVTIRPSISDAELRQAYREADLLLFPSIVEGFGHVLLEALGSGVPILSTDHTAAPDLIDSGVAGFVVPVRRPDLLSDRLRWALLNRAELASMSNAARAAAERFSWKRFRQEIREVVGKMVNPNSVPTCSREMASHG